MWRWGRSGVAAPATAAATARQECTGLNLHRSHAGDVRAADLPRELNEPPPARGPEDGGDRDPAAV